VQFDIYATDDPSDHFVLPGHCGGAMRKVGTVELDLDDGPATGQYDSLATGQSYPATGHVPLSSCTEPAGSGASWSYGGWGHGWGYPCMYSGSWYGRRLAERIRAVQDVRALAGQQPRVGQGPPGKGQGDGHERRLLVRISFGCGEMSVAAVEEASGREQKAKVGCWAGLE
jgi:hypothetical protein